MAFGQIASTYIDVGADLSNLSAGLRAAIQETERAGNTMGSSLSRSVTSAFSDIGGQATSLGAALSVGVTAPLVALATASVAAFGQLDSLKRGLIAVTGSADEAERQFAELREVAKLPGLGFPEAVQGSINLQALGFSAQQSKDILMTFGNALATVGRGRDDLEEVIRQLGQLGARGVVTADNLRPIIERVPQVAAIIKREFGAEALSEPAKRFEELGVSSQKFIEVLVTELGKLPQATGGIKNEFENFMDSMALQGARLGNELAPAVERTVNIIIPLVETAVDAFIALPDAVQNAAIVIAAALAAGGPALIAIGGLASAMTSISGLLSVAGPAFAGFAGALGGGVGAISGAAGATGLLATAMAALPWVAAAAGAVALGIAMTDTEEANDRVTASFQLVGEGANQTAYSMRTLADGTQQYATAVGDAALSIGSQAVAAARQWEAAAAVVKRSVDEIRNAQLNAPAPDWAAQSAALMAFSATTDQASVSTRAYAEEANKLHAETQRGITEYERAKGVLNEVKLRMKEGTASAADLAAAQKQLEAAARAAGVEIKTQTGHLKDLKDEMDEVRRRNEDFAIQQYNARDAMIEAAFAAEEARLKHGGYVETLENGVTVLRYYTEAEAQAYLQKMRLGEASETLNRSVEHGVTVLRGAGAAAKEAAVANTGLGASADAAASGYDRLAESARDAADAMNSAAGAGGLPSFGGPHGAGRGNATVPFSMGLTPVGENPVAGDIRSVNRNSAGFGMTIELWTEEELRWMEEAEAAQNRYIAMLQAVGLSLNEANKILRDLERQAGRSGQSVEYLVKQFINGTEAAEEAARNTKQVADAVNEMSQAEKDARLTGSDLADTIFHIQQRMGMLIEAGQYNSLEYKELETRLNALTGSSRNASGAVGMLQTSIKAVGGAASSVAETVVAVAQAAAKALAPARAATGLSTGLLAGSPLPAAASPAFQSRAVLLDFPANFWSPVQVNLVGGTFLDQRSAAIIADQVTGALRTNAGI